MAVRRLTLVLLVLCGLPVVPVFAQDTPAVTEEAAMPAVTEVPSSGAVLASDAVASGLNNPRHIFFDSDGTLYIAEAGKGGETDAQGPFGPVKAAATSQVSAVSPDGVWSVVVPGLISMDAGFGQIEGATAVVVTEDVYWISLGMGTREPIAEGAQAEAVIALDRATGDVLQTIDLRAFESDNNPDTGNEVVSNPADLDVAPDGTVYIADASGNSLLKWTEADGLSLFAVWPVSDTEIQSVPTSVSVGPDGDVYVGFLSGFPFPPGGARIERYGADGTLKDTYGDLTLVTDVHVTADGTVYAVELANGFGDVGYNADSGRVVRIVDGVAETVADHLNFPYGLAVDSAGGVFVTVNSAFVAPDGGQVIALRGQ